MRHLAIVALVVVVGPAAWADTLRQAHVSTLESRLQLDAATAERMQSVVDKYNGKMSPLQHGDVALLGELRTELALTVPDARRMKSLATELVKNRQRLQSLRDDRLHELQKVLTPEQFSRLLVRWSQVTRELHRQARRARRG